MKSVDLSVNWGQQIYLTSPGTSETCHFVITRLCGLITVFFVFCRNSGRVGRGGPIFSSPYVLHWHWHVCSPIVLSHELLSVKMALGDRECHLTSCHPCDWCIWHSQYCVIVQLASMSQNHLPSVPAGCFNLWTPHPPWVPPVSWRKFPNWPFSVMAP